LIRYGVYLPVLPRKYPDVDLEIGGLPRPPISALHLTRHSRTLLAGIQPCRVLPFGLPGLVPFGLPGSVPLGLPGLVPLGLPGSVPLGLPGSVPLGLPGSVHHTLRCSECAVPWGSAGIK
jgi:hypothetical protein